MCKKDFRLYKAISVMLAGIVFCMSVLVMSMETVHAEDGIVWQKNSELCSVNLEYIAYGNGRYVMVGYEGIIKTSPDAVNWTARESGASEHLFSIVWNGKMFVVGGLKGTILTSPDGITWKKSSLGSLKYPYTVTSIEWDGRQFIATGAYAGLGILLTSPDAITWTTRISASNTSLQKVAWNEGLYAAVGYNGAIYTSKDSVNWISTPSGTENDINDIVYNGKLFTAVCYNGEVLTSSDGAEWTSIQLDDTVSLNNVIWDGHRFIAVCWSGQVYTSSDGTVWTIASPDKNKNFTRIIYHNGVYMAVGGSNFLVSADCINWTSTAIGIPQSFYGIGYNGTAIVVGGTNGTILSSTDGNNWTPVISSTKQRITDIASNGEVFVAVGTGGTIQLSGDGAQWTNIPSGTTYDINKVLWTGNFFIAVGSSSVVLKSTDGYSWTVGSVSPGGRYYLNDIIWDGRRFVVAGMNAIGTPYGVVAVSEDGDVWTSKLIEDNFGFKSIAYNGSCYVASGDRLYKSNDADMWETLSPTAMNKFNSIIWDGKRFLVVGQDGTDGVLLTSTDGTNWIPDKSETSEDLTKILQCGNKYIIAGSQGTIITGTADIPGDLDNDGKANSFDVSLMRDYLMDCLKIEINIKNADFNKDGEINCLDYARMAMFLT
jgi:hypothetical protein